MLDRRVSGAPDRDTRFKIGDGEGAEMAGMRSQELLEMDW